MTQTQDQPETVTWTPWSPDRRQVAILSGADGRAYELRLSTPMGEAPPEGWPCLVVLDGERFFDPFACAVDALGSRSEKTGVRPMVVAGVAFRGAETAQRSLDFTSTPSPERGSDEPHGGADAFRRFILDRVVSEAARALPVDQSRLSLFGHSLAGLFVLETLEARPDAFARWISISPSFWWRTPAVGIGGERLLVGVGENEPARGMTARVSSWAAEGGGAAKVAPGADHGSAPFSLLPDVLRHASGA